MQDDVSYPGKPFAVGLTLEALSAHTVDESGKEAFVTQNPLKLLRKVWVTHCVRAPEHHAYLLHASFCCTPRMRHSSSAQGNMHQCAIECSLFPCASGRASIV